MSLRLPRQRRQRRSKRTSRSVQGMRSEHRPSKRCFPGLFQMNIKPIKTEEDYEAACKRIDEIFQVEPGSKEEEELDILVTLVDAYEEKHFPMGKPHPIEAIKIQMEGLGISRKDLMEHLGKSSGRISDLLNCRRAL